MVPESVQQPLSIAIVGGGPAGLALASTLVQAPDSATRMRITIYESTASFSEIGAGVGVSGRTFAIARALGFEDRLNAMDQRKDKENSEYVCAFRRADEAPQGRNYHKQAMGRGATFHRAQFRMAIAEHIAQFSQVTVEFNKRAVRVTASSSGPSQIEFSDGTSVHADVVIGCDGYRSPTRYGMISLAAQDLQQPELSKLAPAVWSGTRAYRAAFPVGNLDKAWEAEVGPGKPHRLHEEMVIVYTGIDHHICVYLIANRTLVNVVLFVHDLKSEGSILPDSEHVQMNVDTSDLVKRYFTKWEREIQVVVETMGPASVWAVNVVQQLPFFAHSNIAVVGDAAHALTPHMANGANQALEDAYVLGRALSAPGITRETTAFALKAYDAARRPHGQAVAKCSRTFGLLLSWIYTRPGDMHPMRDEEEVKELMSDVTGWVAKGDIEDQVRTAQGVLESNLVTYKWRGI